MVQRVNWSRANENQVMDAMLGPRGRGLGCIGCVPEFFSDCNQMKGTSNDFRGFGGLGCGCTKPGSCGMGLFDAGLDFSQWGAVEWTLLAVGGYMLLSTVSTTQRGAERVRKSFKRYARKPAKD